jgi:hypothetical protein
MKIESLMQRAWNLSFKFLLLFLLVFVATAYAYAGTVRGKLERRDAYGRNYVAAHVAVTLYNKQVGRSSPAYTGNDGMYYLYNVPPGSYYLEIWVYPDREPLRYIIQVYNQSLTDIPPIVIP